jgi:hypothetical protein
MLYRRSRGQLRGIAREEEKKTNKATNAATPLMCTGLSQLTSYCTKKSTE